jgi:hypothetical protein
MLGLACMGAVNLFYAIADGAVFLVRGSGWATFDSNPVAFVISIAASMVLVVGCGTIGVFGLRLVWRERRAIHLLQSRTRYEEPTHVFRNEP